MKSSLKYCDRHSTSSPTPSWAIVLDYIFNAVFIAELAFRMLVLEGSFCGGPARRWNLFDTLLVALSITEMIMHEFDFRPSVIRVLRVVRLFRSLRVLRLMRFAHLVRKLRMMSLAKLDCTVTLMWAVLALIILIFVFSDVFLDAAAQYVPDAGPEDEYVEDQKNFFGSPSMTMLTLFMTVAGGVDWWEVMRLTLDIHVICGLVFVLFVTITVLAVLNVINAIFVNDCH